MTHYSGQPNMVRGDFIFRYEVPVDDQWHRVPLTGDPVAVASRNPRVVEFWAPRDPRVQPHHRLFRVVGTGQPVPEAARHWGTTITANGALVWHLLELSDGEVVKAPPGVPAGAVMRRPRDRPPKTENPY